MTKAKTLIQHFYDTESGATGEGPFVSFSITVPAKDWAMYKAVSERFGTTIKSLVGFNLMGYSDELFLGMNQQDRELVKAKALAFYHDQLAKEGVTETNASGAPSDPWSDVEFLEELKQKREQEGKA